MNVFVMNSRTTELLLKEMFPREAYHSNDYDTDNTLDRLNFGIVGKTGPYLLIQRSDTSNYKD